MKNKLTIAVIAPAGIPNREELDKSITLLKSRGYTVIEGNNLRQSYLYYAGSIQQRVKDIHWALTDPEIDVIWVARGGYGCIHCLPYLPSPEKVSAKIIIGYSDATALFQALSQYNNLCLVHGPMLEGLVSKVDEETRNSIFNMVDNHVNHHKMKLTPLANVTEPIQGYLWGGNLTVLASLCGTPWLSPRAASIILLEDIAEEGYRLDRYLYQLRHSGVFDKAVAIVLGEFTHCHVPKTAQFSLEEMLINTLSPLALPLFSQCPIGHGERNLSWIYGISARLHEGYLYYSAKLEGNTRDE